MAVSYEFSVGSVRAREKSLLTQPDIEQLLSFKSSDEICRFLTDKGYGDGKDVDSLIENHTKNVWKYLETVTPDFSVFEPFIIQNDAHNFKAVLKGTMSGKKYDGLLLKPVTIEPEVFKEVCEHKKFALLPSWFQESAEEAYQTIAHKGDAKLADAVIDKAVMRRMLSLSQNLHSEFLKDYIRTVVFYNDLKILLRSSRTGVDAQFLADAVCEIDGIDFREFSKAAIKSHDDLVELLSKKSDFGCDKAMEEYKKSPIEFEKFVDNKLIVAAKECCKRTSEGAEPLLGYYLGCEAEKKVIHIIASGIKTKIDAEIIRERLREIYG